MGRTGISSLGRLEGAHLTYLIQVPIESGGRLVVQASDEDAGDLQLAALRPGEVVAKASESVERAIAALQPAIRAVRSQLEAMSPDETTVEFGVLLGGETGVIVAKGTSEVHFTVTLTWRRAVPEAIDE